MIHRVSLPSGWLDAQQLDGQLSRQLHAAPPGVGFDIHLGQETRLSIGACVRLLSFVQALSAQGLPVALRGLSAWGLGGYLERIGFYDLLDSGVVVRHPDSSPARAVGEHPHLVELVAVPAAGPRDARLPGRLADRIAACAPPDRQASLHATAFTFFAELIDNIRLHSQSPQPGLAALQVYTPPFGARQMVEVVVADSGAGILSTLRPALGADQPALAALSDEDLLLHAINEGASRNGAEAGCGITQSARGLLRRDVPELSVRVSDQRMQLAPAPGGYAVTDYRRSPALYPLPGTHWVARYALD